MTIDDTHPAPAAQPPTWYERIRASVQATQREAAERQRRLDDLANPPEHPAIARLRRHGNGGGA